MSFLIIIRYMISIINIRYDVSATDLSNLCIKFDKEHKFASKLKAEF